MTSIGWKARILALGIGFLAGCGEGDPGDASMDAGPLDRLTAALDGKTLLMAGADIPSHPNGYDESKNFGSSTQCYSRIEIVVSGSTHTVTFGMGRLENAPSVGDTGTCNHAVETSQSTVDAQVLFENVNDDLSCFDVTYMFTGFVQRGRGSLSADGKTLSLELFYEGQAIGASCPLGPVGSPTVTLNGAPFTGDAVQTFRVQ